VDQSIDSLKKGEYQTKEASRFNHLNICDMLIIFFLLEINSTNLINSNILNTTMSEIKEIATRQINGRPN
jgi:hypothetical protein